jgi:hypothetical protein
VLRRSIRWGEVVVVAGEFYVIVVTYGFDDLLLGHYLHGAHGIDPAGIASGARLLLGGPR